MTMTLQDLGWSAHFQRVLEDDANPERVAEVHRDRIETLSPGGAATRVPIPHLSTGEIAVGDWVTLDPQARIARVLPRQTEIARRAAGTDARRQLIAANVDTLFVVSSCNADFNEARLERYVALARGAGIFPVVVLTKADLAENVGDYRRRAEALARDLAVETVDARHAKETARLSGWCGMGRTAALLGSSGVGKSTLLNALTGETAPTAGVREDDAKGRHTTTFRALRPMTGGGWLIDTPGMRALRLSDAAEGIDAVFGDVAALAETCRFADCAHQSEPGCAVRAAIAEGSLDPDRLARWRKLRAEDMRNSETIAEARARDKSFGRMVRTVQRAKGDRRRD